MRTHAFIPAVLLVLLAACSDDAVTPKAESFTASPIDGPHEVPVRTSTGTGSSTFTVNGTRLDYSLIVSGLTNVTLAHIHIAPVGVSGPVVVPLFLGPTVAATGTNFTLASGSVSATNIVAMAPSTVPISFDSLLVLMRNGQAYVNVHTTAFGAGEIRGQLVKNP